MRERGIPYQAAMVRAVRADTKTQTRRAMREQPPADVVDFCTFHNPKGDGLAHVAFDPVAREYQDWFAVCPYGQVGDRLWVREAWRSEKGLDHLSGAEIADACINAGYSKPWAPVQYEADGERRDWMTVGTPTYPPSTTEPGRYRHGRFMPRWASRILLEVTEVRVERLQSISAADAIAEGLERAPYGWWSGFPGSSSPTPQGAYALLWNHINGPGSWDANPWVWAVSFRRLHA